MLQALRPLSEDWSGSSQSQGNGLHKGDSIFVVHELVRADVNALVGVTKVDLTGLRSFFEGGTLFLRSLNSQSIKKFFVLDLQAHGLEGIGNSAGLRMNTEGNVLKTLGTVVNAIHSCHHGQKNLCGANV